MGKNNDSGLDLTDHDSKISTRAKSKPKPTHTDLRSDLARIMELGTLVAIDKKDITRDAFRPL